MTSGHGSKPHAPDISGNRERILEQIKELAARSKDEASYVFVNGQQLFLLSEGPYARVATKYGTLGWVAGPQAEAPGRFHQFKEHHFKELLKDLPDHNTATGENSMPFVKLVPDLEVDQVLQETRRDSWSRNNQKSEPKLSLRPSTLAALNHFGVALVGIGLMGEWTIGLSLMVGGFVSQLYQTATVKKRLEELDSTLKPLLIDPATTGLLIGAATYGVLSLACPGDVAMIPEHSKGLSLFVGANVLFTLLIFGSNKSERK